MTEPKENNDLFLLDTWRDIVQSEGWSVFKDLLNKHKEYLERQVIINVARKDFDGAVNASSRADECGKILGMVEQRLTELKQRRT